MGWCRLIWIYWLFALWIPLAAGQAVPMIQIERVRELTTAEAEKGLAIKLSGVCTWAGPESCIIHDGEQGIWVDINHLPQQSLQNTPRPQPGDFLKIEGVTAGGGFAPIIVASELQISGVRPLPEARTIPLERLLSGSDDGQWVALEGVVQEVSRPWGKSGGAHMVLRLGGIPAAFLPSVGTPSILRNWWMRKSG